jgi:hypothetical protein
MVEPLCGYRRLSAAFACQPAAISRNIEEWRATVDEDGHYCFAIALRCHGRPRSPTPQSTTPSLWLRAITPRIDSGARRVARSIAELRDCILSEIL